MKKIGVKLLLCPILAAGLLLSPLAQADTAFAAPTSSVSQTSSTAAKSKQIAVYVDDKKLSLSTAPFSENGVTFVPMRPIFDALKASVTWEAKTETIIGRSNGTVVTLTVGKKQAIVDGKAVKMEEAAVVRGGTTFVPARFIAESLGAEVKWDNAANAVRIVSPGYRLEKLYEKIEKEEAAKRKLMTPQQIVAKYDESIVLLATNKAFGSGIVIGDRWILTNYHVIEDAIEASASSIYGDEYEIEGIAGINKKADLAIIQTKEPMDLDKVSLGYGYGTRKGDKVVAIGSPLAIQNTVSEGLISNITYEDGVSFYQTSAPIDHGSSGGALFNEYGELIGITTSGYNSQADLNFAVSVSHAALMYGMLPDKPEKVKFLEPSLPATLVGETTENITALMTKQFSSLSTDQGRVTFDSWNVKRDGEGWYVFSANIDPKVYLSYGNSISGDLRSWALNIGNELRRMLPGENIQMLIYFDRDYTFKPRGFEDGEVTDLGNGRWKVRFPIIDMQLKDQLFIKVRE
ncbi:stalk domain-containing protein [Paenibacillus sp. NPDC058071]|uniref:stalk domain-containing protein n=1 Tax=Paenibacillus sp. NPDC058071 TaxID=3346326 RepID=UPI0036D88DE8